MLALVGEATPNSTTGDIEFFLGQFRQMLSQRGRFAHAWSFSPDEAATACLRQTLDRHEDVFLYLPINGSRLR